MAQRQFRSDDTDPWLYGFGNGSDGSITISSNTTISYAKAGMTGTASTKSVSLDSASSFTNGMIVAIFQVRASSGSGNWELNKIRSGGGTTSLTMYHDLMNTYTDNGSSAHSQIVEIKQYLNVTIDSGKTWSAPNWDQNTGGVFPIACAGTFTNNGTIDVAGNDGASNVTSESGGAVGVGFAGGHARPSAPSGESAWSGEGNINATQRPNTNSANGSGGGAGDQNTAGGAGGGGGGHASSGSGGSKTFDGIGGNGGSTSGSSQLTTMTFGGGGGGGVRDIAGNHGAGGAGGGIFLCLANVFDTSSGLILIDGGDGGDTITTDNGAGGAGAGGSGLIKGSQITLGTNKITATGGTGGSSTASGGSASVGRLHVDYSVSLSGTTNPTISSRNDSTIIPAAAGGFLLAMLM